MITEMLRSRFLNDGEGDSSEFMLLAYNGNNAGDGEIVDQQINNDVGNGVLDQDLDENPVINQAKRLGLSPPPELATFGLTAEEKKRKRTELIKEVFVTENVKVDGMDRNLIPPPRIMPIQGLVLNEPESGIFFMNMNTNIEARSDYIKAREIVEKNLDNKEYAEVLRRVRGGNTLTIISPFEEEQSKLKDCSLKKAGNLTNVYGGINIGLS
uniref:Uncharacterized protein n=1 Tax=Tanacetum cinerariifolium TaxID=118510 RepID=A0A6L2MPM9_TANCI|nr:hypothetical protein [Tanacetum cinerariifolium]